ncbi:DEAD/DEAH box helicase [Pseudofulvimonas gallinarii]|uniref:SWIM zinc finger protein n=1 Tax=Pseudofulvimonas gallinarii TaxID=634155 RepID=A0A4S3KVA8_9GAMM|nr:DEAD/DEAH box helicase [Pseudofulvimonas gallinarii]TCS92776.1 SWIM zinc finger protein [Pseudofulvimonas gallinarii]THD12438.1 hypothetical protein B1808_13025 [Pseudofulvimonas gallinarii]
MDSIDLHQLLAQQGWLALFDERTRARGADYARRGAVREIRAIAVDSDSMVLAATVAGSAGRVYAVDVSLSWRGNRLLVGGRCSCPVGAQCKHVVAVLQVAATRSPVHWPGRAGTVRPPPAVARRVSASARARSGGQPTPAAWRIWLSQVHAMQMSPAQAAPEPASSTESPERLFTFLVSAGKSAGHHGSLHSLRVAPTWYRRGTRKSWVSPQGLSRVDSRLQPAPAGGWSDADQDDLLLLLGSGSAYPEGSLRWTQVGSPEQARALQRLLQRHPAHLEHVSGPALQLRPAVPQRLVWRMLDDGRQSLFLDAGPVEGALDLLQGDVAWLLAEGEGWLAPIEGDGRLLAAMLQAPPLAIEQVDEFNATLGRLSLPVDVPRAADPGPIRDIRSTPQPVLTVRVLDTAPLGARSYGYPHPNAPAQVGVATLAFDYDGVRVPESSDVEVFVGRNGDAVVRVHRDGQAESQALGAMAEAGLEMAWLLASDHGLPGDAFDRSDWLLNHPPGIAAPDQWADVLERLEANGFQIEYLEGFPRRHWAELGDWYADLEAGGSAWFDLSLGIDIDGQRVDLLPILRRLLGDRHFPLQPEQGEAAEATWTVNLDASRRVALPLARLRELLAPLLEWIEVGEHDTLRVHRSQAENLSRLNDSGQLRWRGSETLKAHLDSLRQAANQPVSPPSTFRGELRRYQHEGLAWLNFLDRAGLGGILADDMGLGKTVQVLAHLTVMKQARRLRMPALVVCPTSLVGNWRDEAARFAPRLRVLVLHGMDRHPHFERIGDHDLVITTYPLLARDRERLVEHRFSLLILDEAQAIKNARSQAAQAVRQLDAGRRLAMTGTPLENHLGELWAQFDAVEPGLLGGEREFARLYRTPIEKHGNQDRQARLNRRIGPLLLRRRKESVLDDLPAKTEIVRTLELAGDQRSLYEALRLAQHERVQQAIAKRGLSQAGIVVLDALLKLRQACCDPRLVKLDTARRRSTSVKLEALLELLALLVDEGRRVLVFSQFAEMLGLIDQALEKAGIARQMLTGSTPGAARAGLVRRFQAGEVPVFLISLKAGGVGLNLTAADTVIHYDPWWNPAVEAQATDRAHRIGQDKPVFVYKLLCAGTVEEKIQALQARKAELARAVLEGGSSQRLRFDQSDLDALFAPL